MKHVLTACALAVLAACSQQPAPTKTQTATPEPVVLAPIKTDAPSGTYTLDKTHASLTFKLSHIGFSNYTARFTKFDAKLQLDTANPSFSTLDATADPRSLELPAPPAGFKDELLGPNWLDAKKYPEISFRATKVELTGPDTAKITGDFTLHGVTKPITLDAKFNGGYAGIPNMDPNARIGFSATSVFKRSDFGIAYGVPAPGTTMGVGDDVTVALEAEFTGPPLAAVQGPAPAASP